MTKSIELGVIARGYEDWKKAVFAELLPVQQDTELRRAFFSGARHLLSSIMEIMDSDEEPTERDMAQMEAIEAEFAAFLMAVMEGEA